MEKETNKKTILVVEDDLPVLKALTDKLTREGFQTLQAKNGEEGFLVANKDHPDLIILDIIMPKIDGLSMLKKLRVENSWGKSVPVILLTNLDSNEERINKSVTEDEPAYYIVKTNMSMSDVVEKINERLARKL